MTLEDYLGYKLVKKDGKYYYSSNLYLQGTDITTLPDNLSVSGSLDLSGTDITTLPDNLVIDGYLDIRWTNITTLPDNLIVGECLYGDTKITSLPDNLTVGGNLYLGGTKITSLPNNLIVGRSLYIQGTKISSLPYNLVVGGKIYTDNSTKITKEEVNKVNHNVPNILFWGNKKYAKIVDWLLFYKILSYKGNIYEVSEIKEDKIQYLITNSDCSKFTINSDLEKAKKEYNLLNIKKE